MNRYTLAGAEIARDGVGLIRDRTGERTLRWGLLRPWQGHGGKRGPNVYVTTADEIGATPFLRAARTKARCLVRADGWIVKAGPKKVPYWIHAPGVIAFAGICATHGDDGVESFALVSVPATGIVTPYAATMPAVVDERWLDGELVPSELAGWRADAPGANLAQGSLF
jgi:putative SOS response-associated peptidase YedK